MDKETVLVTGASAGIGLELARAFAPDGVDFVLVARRGDRLEELAQELRRTGAEVCVVPMDLSERDAPKRLFDQLGGEDAGIDILINNAGFGARGKFAEIDEERLAGIVHVNTVALTRLSRQFLPQMIARGRGGILNIASTASFQADPYLAVYGATKAYVLSLSEALAEETRKTGVTVTALCPGLTISEFHDIAGTNNMTLAFTGMATTESVAKKGHRTFRKGKVVAITGLLNQILAHSGRFTPRFIMRRIAGLLVG